jgi:hypothetical protein
MKEVGKEGATQYDWVRKADGEKRRLSQDETLEDGDELFHIGDASTMFTTPHLALPYKLGDVEGRFTQCKRTQR